MTLPDLTGARRSRESPFSYRCHGCHRCCSGRRIPLGPYELARLARQLGTDTGTVIREYTSDGGVALAAKEDGACVFLGPEGCRVHPDRPLACRLYPLGRAVRHDREEFVQLVGHPQSAGEYGNGGTVRDYLDRQEVWPYLAAGEAYRRVFGQRMAGEPAPEAEAKGPEDAEAEALDYGAGLAMDVDLVVAMECERQGVDRPEELEARITIHLSALRRLAGESRDGDAA